MSLIQDLPRINSVHAVFRWLRLLFQAVLMTAGSLLPVWPKPVAPPIDDPADTVILVTLDGVRPRDLLLGQDTGLGAEVLGAPTMPYMMNDLVPKGVFLGSAEDPPAFRLGSPVGISMSGYHSIFAGRMTRCISNEDPPPKGDTLVTDLQDAFPGETAFLSTWPLLVQRLKIDPNRAVSVAGRDAALACLADRGTGLAEDSPHDLPVVELALELLRSSKPRFIFIGLDESDGAAHSGNYKCYVDALGRFDTYIKRIAEAAESLRKGGRKVTLIITTDHGRGEGEEWVEHRWNIAGTARCWFFAHGHAIAAAGHVLRSRQRTHFDVRPTIAHLLRLPARRRRTCGAVMTELFRGPGARQ